MCGLLGREARCFLQNLSARRVKLQQREVSATFSDCEPPQEHTLPSWRRFFNVVAVCVSVWFTPIILLGALRGWDDIFVQEGVFFSKAAMVTFGGAYSVLAYVAQQAVHDYGWIKPEQIRWPGL